MTAGKDARIVLVCGGRGSGKSTFAKAYLKPVRNVVVFDAMAEYADAGFFPARTGGDLKRALRRGQANRVAFIPPHGVEPAASLNALCEALFAFQHPYKLNGPPTPQIWLVVEEMSQCFTAKHEAKAPAMLRAINQGRHWGLNILGLTQRPALVSPTFRGQAAERYFFRLDYEQDVVEVSNLLGRQYADDIRNLEPHHYIAKDLAGVRKGKNRLR